MTPLKLWHHHLSIFALAVLAGCRMPGPHASGSSTRSATDAPTRPTTAEAILALESTGWDLPAHMRELHATTDLAVTRFRASVPADAETEEQIAMRFFATVDRALIDRGYVYPPQGLVELLYQALKPRILDPATLERCMAEEVNLRRKPVIAYLRKAGGPLHMVDCDTAAVFYLIAAERLNFPVTMVVVPNHMFVRWSSPTLKCNWDTNIGARFTDVHFVSNHGVTEQGRALLGWMMDMPPTRVRSYWQRNVGNWHERHGRYTEALAAYRHSVILDPTDLEAANALAWFLATCPVASFRDAAEAESIAARLVAMWPRDAWTDTLAAAQAERGNFAEAIATKRNSSRTGNPATGSLGFEDAASDSDDAVRAYARGLTYVEGVADGSIYVPKAALPYDD